jgi:hypothetical protein
MYSFLEIEFIFKNCFSWEELMKACDCFLFIIPDGDLPIEHRQFIAEQSSKRYRQIENL